MSEIRSMTNKGLQLIGESTGIGVIVFTKAYLSRETLSEGTIYAMTTASGTSSTTNIHTTEVDAGYVVIAEFDSPDSLAKTAILCGRLESQTEEDEIPICVYSSTNAIGLSGSTTSVTFTLTFSQLSDGMVQPSDTPMTRGEIIAYINYLFSQQSANPASNVVLTTGDQTINGVKTFKSKPVFSGFTADGDLRQGLSMDTVLHKTKLTGGNAGTDITLNEDSIELNSTSVIIPYKGQQRSVQNILSSIQGSNAGSLRHGLYTFNINSSYVESGTIPVASLALLDTTEQVGDMSLSGTHFLDSGYILYAVVCIATADASEFTSRETSFGTQKFRVSLVMDGTLTKTVEASFKWYENKQDLLGSLISPASLPCFAGGTQCACATLIPLNGWHENVGQHTVELGISNAVGIGSAQGMSETAQEIFGEKYFRNFMRIGDQAFPSGSSTNRMGFNISKGSLVSGQWIDTEAGEEVLNGDVFFNNTTNGTRRGLKTTENASNRTSDVQLYYTVSNGGTSTTYAKVSAGTITDPCTGDLGGGEISAVVSQGFGDLGRFSITADSVRNYISSTLDSQHHTTHVSGTGARHYTYATSQSYDDTRTDEVSLDLQSDSYVITANVMESGQVSAQSIFSFSTSGSSILLNDKGYECSMTFLNTGMDTSTGTPTARFSLKPSIYTNGGLRPATFDLGTSTNRFNTLYVNSVDLSALSSEAIQTNSVTPISGNILAVNNASLTLGEGRTIQWMLESSGDESYNGYIAGSSETMEIHSSSTETEGDTVTESISQLNLYPRGAVEFMSSYSVEGTRGRAEYTGNLQIWYEDNADFPFTFFLRPEAISEGGRPARFMLGTEEQRFDNIYANCIDMSWMGALPRSGTSEPYEGTDISKVKIGTLLLASIFRASAYTNSNGDGRSLMLPVGTVLDMEEGCFVFPDTTVYGTFLNWNTTGAHTSFGLDDRIRLYHVSITEESSGQLNNYTLMSQHTVEITTGKFKILNMVSLPSLYSGCCALMVCVG